MNKIVVCIYHNSLNLVVLEEEISSCELDKDYKNFLFEYYNHKIKTLP